MLDPEIHNTSIKQKKGTGSWIRNLKKKLFPLRANFKKSKQLHITQTVLSEFLPKNCPDKKVSKKKCVLLYCQSFKISGKIFKI